MDPLDTGEDTSQGYEDPYQNMSVMGSDQEADLGGTPQGTDDSTQNMTPIPEEPELDSDTALDYASKAFDLPYDQGTKYLTDLYKNTAWSDPEIAAQKIAETARNYRRFNLVQPDASLNSDAAWVTQRIMDKKLTEDEKLAFIEDWATKSKQALYNNVEPESLLSAKEKEDRIDAYTRELRRGVVAGNVGHIKDSIARGIEAAISPIAGVTDVAFGTDIKSDLEARLENNTNPKFDNGFIAKASSMTGSVLGTIGASAGGPVGAWSYLGAMLVDQSKSVYDATLKDTNDPALAKEAMLKSVPGNVVGMFADRFIGKGVVSAFAKQPTYLGAVTGALAGSAGATVQTLGTGAAISSTTGANAMPTAGETAEMALVGGLVGGGFGGAADVMGHVKAGTFKFPTRTKTVKDVEQYDVESKPEELLASILTPGETVTKEVAPEATAIPEERILSDAAIASPVEATEISAEAATPEAPKEVTYKTIKEANAAGVKVVNETPTTFIPHPMLMQIARNFGMTLKALPPEALDVPGKMVFGQIAILPTTPEGQKTAMDAGFKPAIVVRRTSFKNPSDALRTLYHEIGHSFDFMRSLRTKHPDVLGPDTITGKLLDGYDRAEKAYSETLNKMPQIEAEALHLTKLERPNFEGDPEYRGKAEEIFADVFGAFMRDPDYVKQVAPVLHDAMYSAFTKDPYLATMMKKAEKFRNDPQARTDWMIAHREQGRTEEGRIYANRIESFYLGKQQEIKEAPRKAKNAIATKAVNSLHIPRMIVDKALKEAERKGLSSNELTNQLEGLYNLLYKSKDAHNSIFVQVDKALYPLLDRLKELGLPHDEKSNVTPLGTWKTYALADHFLKETTSTLDALKRDPQGYKQAVDIIAKEHPDNQALQAIAAKVADPAMQGDALEETLAQLQHPRTFKESAQPEVMKELLELYKKSERLKAKEANSEKELPEEAPEEPTADQVKEAYVKSLDSNAILKAVELMHPEAFQVRRYMAHPDMSLAEAKLIMKTLPGKLGEAKFKGLQKLTEDFHKIISTPLLKAMKESGKYSPKFIQKVELNKASYITTNVLKHFMNSPIVASTAGGKGTFEIVGDELASTIMKTKAFLKDAYRQTMENALLNISAVGKLPVEKVTLRGNIYSERNKLQKLDPKNSYLIRAEDGVQTLYKVGSPDLHGALEDSALMKSPMTKPFIQAFDAFTKVSLAKELKTFLSGPFTLASRFRDTGQEALLARIWEMPGLPIHTNEQARNIKKKSVASAEDYLKGNLTPDLVHFLDSAGLSYNTGASHGQDSYEAMPIEAALYEMSGVPIPKEMDFSKYSQFQAKALKIVEKIPFMKTIKHYAERDEVATKLAAYYIARDMRGMPDQKAIRVMREWAGTPDPIGGGVEAVAFNKIFLFGRAHINGMRGIANQFGDDPVGYSMQYAYRKLLPRLIVSGALMGPLIGALFGEEDEQIARKYLDKLSTYKKISSIMIPTGMTDAQGNFRPFGSFNSSEIGRDWKSAAISIPSSQEMVAMDQLYTPLIATIEELADTGTISLKHIGNRVAAAMKAVGAGNINPGAQTAYQLSELAAGYNPTDFYRNKGILPKDVADAGNFAEKLYSYLGWALYNDAPGLFSVGGLTSKSTSTGTPLDYLTAIPQVGGIMNRFISISNYGDMEKDQALAVKKQEFDASVREEMGSNTHDAINQYSRMSAMVSSLGKAGMAKEPPAYKARVHAMNVWHSRVYSKYKNEIAEALQKGDAAEVKRLSAELEANSAGVLNYLKGQ